MVDIVRQEKKSWEHYLGGYLKFMRETWTKIPPDQIDEARSHVESYDSPKAVVSYMKWHKPLVLTAAA